MDPLRETSFPQNWTIYYWAYWMVWCVATPFFIGKISRGRTIRQVVLQGYSWGLAGTFASFIILGNYGLAQQVKYGVDISGTIAETGDYAAAALQVFETLPLPALGLLLLVINMIVFYASTFDALTVVVASYSYKRLDVDKEPSKAIIVFWAIVFVIFPIALIFAQNTLHSLQSVAIIAAFPVGFIILLIILSFYRDVKAYLGETPQPKRM
jgi:BCCT family betaine/carnitine transporter